MLPAPALAPNLIRTEAERALTLRGSAAKIPRFAHRLHEAFEATTAMPPLVVLQAQQPGLLEVGANFVPFAALLLLGWLLFIRPMSKERKQKEAMRAALKGGDKVLTIGGIHGTVTRVDDHKVTLRVADGVQIQFARNAIATVLTTATEE